MYSGQDTWFASLSTCPEGQTTTKHQVGCPIRRSLDQSLFPAPQSLSQSITSFIASCCQGIHQTPFSRLIRSRERKAGLLRPGPCRGPASLTRPLPSDRKSYILSAPAPMQTGPRQRLVYLTWNEAVRGAGPPRGAPPPAPPSRGDGQTASVFSLHDVSRPHRTGERRPAALADAMIDGAWLTASRQRLVEPVGIEPTTPCLQSRCSPS